jgi:Asp-tRNA(Asn)/Glu-tRNA(Gln) amidotransferase A subunit family amidase
MNNEDICFMSATDMADKIKRQEITSVEITEAIIERIQKINPTINAYCTTTFDLAREMAKKADDAVKKGEKLGILNGVPTSVKDLIYLKGVRTTFGSKIYENYIAEEDSVCIKRLKEAGCVILGKTNTPEFGWAGVTFNLVFGTSNNPWDLGRTTGGSSGGAAAACASGISPLAQGSDGGGSLRHPTALCGVYGLKPHYGRIPVYPKRGFAGYALTQPGPITRYVKDAAMMLEIMKGPHESDMESLPAQNINYVEGIKDLPNKLKIGYTLSFGNAKVVDTDVEKCILDSVQKFDKFGWEIDQVKMKLRAPHIPFLTLWTASYAYDLKPILKKWRDQIDPEFIKAVDAGFGYDGLSVIKSFAQRRKIYEAFYPVLKDYDVLLSPTTAIPAFEHGIRFPTEINGKGVSPTAWMPYTYPANMIGNPAASIPAGFSSEGLPIGMQILGRRFDELTVLQVSKAFEEVAPWQEKHPKLE